MTEDGKVKPLFIVKPGTMKRRDILRAEKHAHICVVECSDPENVRYLDAPADAGLDVQARAALTLMRLITKGTGPYNRGELLKWFVDQILDWTAQPVNIAKVPHVPESGTKK